MEAKAKVKVDQTIQGVVVTQASVQRDAYQEYVTKSHNEYIRRIIEQSIETNLGIRLNPNTLPQGVSLEKLVADVYVGVMGAGAYQAQLATNTSGFNYLSLRAFDGGDGVAYNSDKGGKAIQAGQVVSMREQDGLMSHGFNVYEYGTDDGQWNSARSAAEAKAVGYIAKSKIADPLNSSRQTEAWTRHQIVDDANGKAVLENRTYAVNGQTFTVQARHDYKVFEGRGQFIGFEQNDALKKFAAALNVDPETIDIKSGMDELGHEYQLIYDTNRMLKAVLFEGKLFNDFVKSQGDRYELDMDFEDHFQNSRLNNGSIKVNGRFVVQGDTMILQRGSVGDGMDFLMDKDTQGNDRRIRKGDRIQFYVGNDGEHFGLVRSAQTGKVIGMTMSGRVYEPGEKDDLFRVDRAKVRAVDPQTGKIERVQMTDIYKQGSADIGIIRESREITRETTVGGITLPVKTTIDSLTGALIPPDGTRLGTYHNERIYLRDGAHYVFNAKDESAYEFLKNEGVATADELKENTLRIKADVFERAVESQNRAVHAFETAMAYATKTGNKGDLEHVSRIINERSHRYGVTASVVEVDGTHLIQLKAVEGQSDHPVNGLVRMMAERYEDKVVTINPDLDKHAIAALSAKRHFHLGSGLARAVMTGVMDSSTMGVLVHEFIHEEKKKFIAEGLAKGLDQSRITSLMKDHPILKIFAGIYDKDYSTEESITFMVELFGLPDDGVIDQMPAQLKAIYAPLKTLLLEVKTKYGLPKSLFKGKYFLLKEALDGGDEDEAKTQLKNFTDLLTRGRAVTAKNIYVYDAAIEHIQGIKDWASEEEGLFGTNRDKGHIDQGTGKMATIVAGGVRLMLPMRKDSDTTQQAVVDELIASRNSLDQMMEAYDHLSRAAAQGPQALIATWEAGLAGQIKKYDVNTAEAQADPMSAVNLRKRITEELAAAKNNPSYKAVSYKGWVEKRAAGLAAAGKQTITKVSNVLGLQTAAASSKRAFVLIENEHNGSVNIISNSRGIMSQGVLRIQKKEEANQGLKTDVELDKIGHHSIAGFNHDVQQVSNTFVAMRDDPTPMVRNDV